MLGSVALHYPHLATGSHYNKPDRINLAKKGDLYAPGILRNIRMRFLGGQLLDFLAPA